jgi:hypothetical protein
MGIFSRVERDANDFFRSRRGGDYPRRVATAAFPTNDRVGETRAE